MCTLTVISIGDSGDGVRGYRLVHSRDEQRTRAPGEPGQWRDTPSGRVWSPRDPDAGGTWLGVREDGLAYGLLNLNIPPNGRPTPTATRGRVIDRLFAEPVDAEGDADLARIAGFGVDAMAPFRLVRVETGTDRAWLARWDGLGLEVQEIGRPVCLVSSGLGDDRVLPRLGLFDEMVIANPTARAQDAYHRHRWNDRPEISVLMSRETARTESIVTVEVNARGVDARFERVPETEVSRFGPSSGPG